MSGLPVPSLEQLPLEILHGIFHYLDVSDILRMRWVSRYLNELSHDRHVWNVAYRTAKFVRPPGPFLSQSAQDLERALVPCFRVDHKLRNGSARTQETPTLKLREIRYTGAALQTCLTFGRFLFIAFREEVRCYDLNADALDSNSGASIIHRSTGRTIGSFHCVSAFDTEGRSFACVVLNEATEMTAQVSIYLLNVREGSEVTLDLLHQSEDGLFNIDDVVLGPRLIIVQGQRPDLDGDLLWHFIVLDVHTRTQFVFSSFIHAALEEFAELPRIESIEQFTAPIIISTSTHLLVARSFYTRAGGWSTFLQAFALSPALACHHSTPTLLSPSHHGSIAGINMCNTILLHDAILDLTTRDVLVAIRVHAYEPSRPRGPLSKHGILHLSPTPAFHSHDGEVGTITFQLLGPLGRVMPFLHPSFNGTGRSFYMIEPGWCIVSALEYDLTADSNSNGQHGAEVTEYPSVLTLPAARRLLDYDPYFGRICLRSTMTKYSVIEVFDLAA